MIKKTSSKLNTLINGNQIKILERILNILKIFLQTCEIFEENILYKTLSLCLNFIGINHDSENMKSFGYLL